MSQTPAAERIDPLHPPFGLRLVGKRPRLLEYVRDAWARRYFAVRFAFGRVRLTGESTRLGRMWLILNPLLNAGVYYLVFGVLFGARKNIPHFIAFLLIGVFVFRIGEKTLTSANASISGNKEVIRSLSFPRILLPLSAGIFELALGMVSAGILLVMILFTGITISWSWVLLPLVVIGFWLTMLGWGMLLARINTQVRDLGELLPFITRLWLYGSGVMYSLQLLLKDHHSIYVLISMQPGALYLDLAREVLMGPGYAMWWQVPLAFIWPLMLIPGMWFIWRGEPNYGRV
jgi:teichoic acid transport system permease protein